MKISSLLAKGKPLFSFEFFPPKTDKGFESLFQTIEHLRELRPDYVSVTFGAGGSTREKTVELTARIKREIGLEAMAHLTCVAQTRDEIAAILDEHAANGIDNILALRGDPPTGQRAFQATEGGFGYAIELVDFIARDERWDFCLGVAGYPEGHPECLNRTRDVEHLKAKCDAGGEFIVTQLFFDNADMLRWRDRLAAAGVTAPIIAGIMPITNAKQIKRFVSMCGTKIQHDLLLRLEEVEEDEAAVTRIGIDHATHQCEELLREGIGGIHFYTLNKSHATVDIFQNLTGRGALAARG
jgi:methylenetetrahydrofolate reductase (NADPH)